MCIDVWLEINPPHPSGPEQCIHCGVPLIEPGIDGVPAGHVWLHDACHVPWYAARRVEAAKALVAMGINVGPDTGRT